MTRIERVLTIKRKNPLMPEDAKRSRYITGHLTRLPGVKKVRTNVVRIDETTLRAHVIPYFVLHRKGLFLFHQLDGFGTLSGDSDDKYWRVTYEDELVRKVTWIPNPLPIQDEICAFLSGRHSADITVQGRILLPGTLKPGKLFVREEDYDRLIPFSDIYWKTRREFTRLAFSF